MCRVKKAQHHTQITLLTTKGIIYFKMLYLFRNSNCRGKSAAELNSQCVNKMSQLIQWHEVVERFSKEQLHCFLGPYCYFI